MGKIIIGTSAVSFEAIKKGNWPNESAYIEQSLAFCQAWLNGEEHFQLQTSGSTGNPKKINVKRQQMEFSAAATGQFFNIPEEANLLCCLNTRLIAGKMMLVRGMEWNSTIYLEEPSGTPLANFDQSVTFDFAAMVPAQVENCINHPIEKEKLNHIRQLIIGGAPLAQNLQREVALLACNTYQTYGMTETVSHIALAKITGNPPLNYQTLPGVVISTTPDARLVIDAPMADAVLTTTDIVSLPQPNRFIWQGRADFTINSGGIKIQPEQLEIAIHPIMAIHLPGKRYFIAGAPHEKWGEEVVLIVESARISASKEEQIKSEIAAKVSKYERPKNLYFLDNFIETPSGKIKLKANLNQALNKII